MAFRSFPRSSDLPREPLRPLENCCGPLSPPADVPGPGVVGLADVIVTAEEDDDDDATDADDEAGPGVWARRAWNISV